MKVIKRMSSPLKQHMFQIIMDCLFFCDSLCIELISWPLVVK